MYRKSNIVGLGFEEFRNPVRDVQPLVPGTVLFSVDCISSTNVAHRTSPIPINQRPSLSHYPRPMIIGD